MVVVHLLLIGGGLPFLPAPGDSLWTLTPWPLGAPGEAKSTHDQCRRKDHEGPPQSSQFRGTRPCTLDLRSLDGPAQVRVEGPAGAICWPLGLGST
jgi:hypothetical protein